MEVKRYVQYDSEGRVTGSVTGVTPPDVVNQIEVDSYEHIIGKEVSNGQLRGQRPLNVKREKEHLPQQEPKGD